MSSAKSFCRKGKLALCVVFFFLGPFVLLNNEAFCIFTVVSAVQSLLEEIHSYIYLPRILLENKPQPLYNIALGIALQKWALSQIWPPYQTNILRCSMRRQNTKHKS